MWATPCAPHTHGAPTHWHWNAVSAVNNMKRKNTLPGNCSLQWAVVACFDHLTNVNKRYEVTKHGCVFYHARGGWCDSHTYTNQPIVIFAKQAYLTLVSILNALNPCVFASLCVWLLSGMSSTIEQEAAWFTVAVAMETNEGCIEQFLPPNSYIIRVASVYPGKINETRSRW